jgi:hypothetical protein
MKIKSLLARYALRSSTITRKPVLLENIRVAAPCPASWEQMQGDSRVRHCGECKLNVYNLSEMTREQAESLIASREGRLCVRFYRRADGTVLTRNCPRGLEAMVRRVSRIAGAVVTATMSLGAAFAQAAKPAPSQEKQEQAQQKFQFIFTVVDEQGAVVAGARFRLADNNTGAIYESITDSRGVGIVSGLAPGSFALRIEFQGFKTYEEAIAISQNKTETIRLVISEVGAQATVGILMIDDGSVVEHDDASLKTTISGDFLRSLPMR